MYLSKIKNQLPHKEEFNLSQILNEIETRAGNFADEVLFFNMTNFNATVKLLNEHKNYISKSF